jgi:UDPglucose 6-dehydrogenase
MGMSRANELVALSRYHPVPSSVAIKGIQMQIAVIGLGYVGLVTATCLARLGQHVIGLEVDADKLSSLERGEAPYYEPGLQSELTVQQREGRLRFTLDPQEALRGTDVVLVCVGTPSAQNGEADLGAVHSVFDTLGRTLDHPVVVALRSTVPVGTTRRVERTLNETLAGRGVGWTVPVLANPEFLRTGRAIEDFLHPSRVVVGQADLGDEGHVEQLSTLYRPLEAPILIVDAESAELTKNAANAYLATRISFINELAMLCDATGAVIDDVLRGISSDPRIGGEYLRPGIGYGGSCLPKDVRSMIAMGRQRDVELALANAVDAVNADQPRLAADRLATELGGDLSGARVALLGLAFKPGTDDIRDSPALALAAELRDRGATVVGCDPKAANPVARQAAWLTICAGPMEAATGADAVVLATEWPEYVTLSAAELASAMKGDLLFDARNALEPAPVRAAGLRYVGVGRSSVAGD